MLEERTYFILYPCDYILDRPPISYLSRVQLYDDASTWLDLLIRHILERADFQYEVH